MRIREIIKEKGLSTEELAAKLGVSVSSINQSISGNPTVDTLTRIADALDVPIAELFEKPIGPTLTCPHCGKPINIKVE